MRLIISRLSGRRDGAAGREPSGPAGAVREQGMCLRTFPVVSQPLHSDQSCEVGRDTQLGVGGNGAVSIGGVRRDVMDSGTETWHDALA